MKYQAFNSQNYLELQSTYHLNSLQAKTIDYMKLDSDTITNLNRMIFHDYSLFSEADEVYERIMEAIENKEKICIYGDYDMDGILATTILVKTFDKLGVKVGYHIPNRFVDGYGLNVERVEQMAEKGYSLIITVDNGISAFDAIERAEELGVDVIVTDHHELSNDLPLAYAILHTKISPDYPFKEICGGMVAYKLATKLLGRHDMYLFTLACCTTVSDMMPLLNENRAVVKKGLALMNQNRYPGFVKLVNDPNKPFTATTISYDLAPKINAVGRLPDLMNPNNAVRYFIDGENGSPFLDKFALKCKELNSKRQSMTTEYYNLLNPMVNQELPYIFLYEQEVHEGLLGLLAGKFSSEYHKVTFVMNYDEKNNIYKGSARSIPGFHLRNFLESASEDLEVFGGHALAAGFSVKYDCIPSFEQKVKEALSKTVFEEERCDFVALEGEDLTIENVNSLKLLEPFGFGFTKPLYGMENVEVIDQTLMKDKHLRLQCQKGNLKFNAVWFNHASLVSKSEITLIGEAAINSFRGNQSIQFLLKDIVE